MQGDAVERGRGRGVEQRADFADAGRPQKLQCGHCVFVADDVRGGSNGDDARNVRARLSRVCVSLYNLSFPGFIHVSLQIERSRAARFLFFLLQVSGIWI